MTSSTTTVREASFAVFDHFGVDALFGNPGSTELPMLRDLPESIPYILGLNEAIVLGMADGYAQATRRPSLVNLHSSAGTGNALGNLFTAYRNNAPVVVTAGQQARSILPFDPFLGAERPTEFPRPFVKWACEPARAEDVPLALARAFHIAMTPPTGPVFVSVPVDDWDRECEMPVLPELHLAPSPRAEDIGQLAAMLDAAERPALVMGTGVARSGGWAAGVALAERCQADVWCAPLVSRETFPENHVRFAGFLPAYRERIVELLSPYDAVLVAGAQAFAYHVEGHGPRIAPDTAFGLLSDDPQHLSFQPSGTGVLGDVAHGLAMLADSVAARPERPPNPRAAPPEPSVGVDYILHRIAALRPADAILVEEAPTARSAMHDHLPINCIDGFFSTASGGIGYAMPAAVGIARNHRERKVIALIGDGSAMYNIQALWSATKQNANVSFLILNNRRYAALDGFSEHFDMNAVPGTDISGINFVALAESMGLTAQRVDDLDVLDEALNWSFDSSSPTLVELTSA